MKSVDLRLLFFVIDNVLADIFIEHSVGKAELVLVRGAGKTVGRHLFNKFFGQAEVSADSLYLCNRETGDGAEVARAVAVACGVANPVLGKVAGVCNSAVFRLRNSV